jgi:UDP-glucose 4-epimerase
MKHEPLVVVTGGAGFIGSHLATSLLAQGRRVRIVDDLSSGKRSNLPPGAEFLEGDVLDLADRAVEDADTVYHLAAQVSVSRSVAAPRESHRSTAESTLAMLEASEKAGVRRFVLASSSAVYGNAEILPRREDQAPEPASPYAAAKLTSEVYSRYWASRGPMETVALRFFNVYGPRQDPTSPYAAAIPTFINRLASGRPIPIFGDGTQTRDFTFVDDVVRGLDAAGLRPAVSGRVFNIASGRSITILELVGLLGGILGQDVSIDFRPPRTGDIHHSAADIGQARQALGFVPEVSLAEGLRKTVASSSGAPMGGPRTS